MSAHGRTNSQPAGPIAIRSRPRSLCRGASAAVLTANLFLDDPGVFQHARKARLERTYGKDCQGTSSNPKGANQLPVMSCNTPNKTGPKHASV